MPEQGSEFRFARRVTYTTGVQRSVWIGQMIDRGLHMLYRYTCHERMVERVSSTNAVHIMAATL